MPRPSVRRIVTGHDPLGKSVVVSERLLSPAFVASGDAAMALVWTTPAVPADNNDPQDGAERDAGTTLKGGSVIRVVDMMPGSTSPLHRTNSIDYGIIVSGRLELVLDDGQVTKLTPGDIVVQRGTLHAWRNPSPSEACRIVFVLIEASAAIVNGQPLRPVHP